MKLYLAPFPARRIGCECCWDVRWETAKSHQLELLAEKQSRLERLIFSRHKWLVPLNPCHSS